MFPKCLTQYAHIYVYIVNNLIMIAGENCRQVKTYSGRCFMREQKFTLS